MVEHVKASATEKPAIQVTIRDASKGAGVRVASRVGNALDGLLSEFGVQVRQEVWHNLRGGGDAWHAVEKLRKRASEAVGWLESSAGKRAAAAGSGASAAAGVTAAAGVKASLMTAARLRIFSDRVALRSASCTS